MDEKMKFTTSLNRKYPNIPRKWLSCNKETEYLCIMDYFRKHIQVFDADICGDESCEFVFESGNAYKLDYEWWIEHDPEFDLKEDFQLEQIPLSEVKTCGTKYRDWI